MLVEGGFVARETALVLHSALDVIEDDARQLALRHPVQIFDIDCAIEVHGIAPNSGRRYRHTLRAAILPPQEIGAELVEARTADLPHDEIDLVAEDRDRLLDPGNAAGGCAIKRRPAHKAEAGAEAQRDQDVGAAPHSAVEHHRQLVADCLLDRRQYVERGRRLVELAAAMVRHDDAVAADLGGAQRVARIHDAL